MKVPFKVEKQIGRKQEAPMRVTKIKKEAVVSEDVKDEFVRVPAKKISDLKSVKKEILNSYKRAKEITAEFEKLSKELSELMEKIKFRAEKYM